MIVPATIGVSRSTFLHDDTHTHTLIDSQGENNTSRAVAAVNYVMSQPDISKQL